MLLQDGDRFVYLFLTFLTKIKTEDSVQYLLTLIEDAITGACPPVYSRTIGNKALTRSGVRWSAIDHPERIKYFTNAGNIDDALPYGPLLKCLEKENSFITQKASLVITALLWCVRSFRVPLSLFSGRI